MNTISRLAGAAAIALAAVAAQAQGVGGTYTVAGTNFDGSAYGGTAVIEMDSAKTCSIRWQTGETSSVGSCMIRGDIVAAAYALSTGDVGLVIYRRRADGALDGTWTVKGADGEGTEILTPR